MALCRANAAYESHRASGVGRNGGRLGPQDQPKPYTPPPRRTADQHQRPGLAAGQGRRGWVQVYTSRQSPTPADRHRRLGHGLGPGLGLLDPMLDAAYGELDAVGVKVKPQTVLADAGYWPSGRWNDRRRRPPGADPPDSGKRKGNRPGWNGGVYGFMREVLSTELGTSLYRRRQQLVEPVFANTKHNRINRFHRRGRAAVRTEWRLITATHNLLKLHRHQLATAAG